MGLVFSCGMRSFGRPRAESHYSDRYMPYLPSVPGGPYDTASSHALLGVTPSVSIAPGVDRASGGKPGPVPAPSATKLVGSGTGTPARRPNITLPVPPAQGPCGTEVLYGTVPWNKFHAAPPPCPMPSVTLPLTPPVIPAPVADAGDDTDDTDTDTDDALSLAGSRGLGVLPDGNPMPPDCSPRAPLQQ